jgi:Bacterial regulatory proteins, luxR family
LVLTPISVFEPSMLRIGATLPNRVRGRAVRAPRTSNVEIAEHMTVSVKMIEKHLSSVYLKLGVGSRSKLLAKRNLRRPSGVS